MRNERDASHPFTGSRTPPARPASDVPSVVELLLLAEEVCLAVGFLDPLPDTAR